MGRSFVQGNIPVGQTTTGRWEQTCDDPKECAFPRSIGANECNQLSLMDFKRKIPKDLEVPIMGIQMFN
jgi:hypothetical protein